MLAWLSTTRPNRTAYMHYDKLPGKKKEKKNPFRFFFCVCVIVADRHHSPAQQKVPINEQCFIKVGSSPWHRQAPLGPVMEIDCNLTKRLWAPDCTHAKVWFGGQRAELESGLRYNAEEKSFRKLKRPLLVFLPPLHSSVSFQSLISHPVCVLIHLHPRLPSFLIASPPSSSVFDRFLLAGQLSVSSSRKSTQMNRRCSVSRRLFASGEESICCPQTVTSVIVFVHFFFFRECSGTVLFPLYVVATQLARRSASTLI